MLITNSRAGYLSLSRRSSHDLCAFLNQLITVIVSISSRIKFLPPVELPRKSDLCSWKVCSS